MTLMDKFKQLTPEQREELTNLKDLTGLDAFTSKHSIELNEEEKLQAKEYFESGKLPLSDDDLDMVAGGKEDPTKYCHFKTNPFIQYFRENSKIYFVCGNYYDCGICSCYNTKRCINRNHEMEEVEPKTCMPVPPNKYHHYGKYPMIWS